jgi:hypothetical protein
MDGSKDGQAGASAVAAAAKEPATPTAGPAWALTPNATRGGWGHAAVARRVAIAAATTAGATPTVAEAVATVSNGRGAAMMKSGWGGSGPESDGPGSELQARTSWAGLVQRARTSWAGLEQRAGAS